MVSHGWMFVTFSFVDCCCAMMGGGCGGVAVGGMFNER